MASATSETPSKDKAPVVCVFCGASDGVGTAHLKAARALGEALHQRSAKLIYGGGTRGLMGEVAKTLVSLSGPDAVRGFMPRPLVPVEAMANIDPEASNEELARKVENPLYGRLTIVDFMDERKELMGQEVRKGGVGSGFVGLSGGFGSLDEIMEMTTWAQLNIQTLPVVLLDVNGYWNGLLQWVNDAVAAGFITEMNKEILASAHSANEVMEKLRTFKPSEGRYKLQWKHREGWPGI